uniref:CSON008927 protein n=1 Tax=Culicoides sonorensis TaxID=179676 RepID=A0A336MXL0_CULSO
MSLGNTKRSLQIGIPAIKSQIIRIQFDHTEKKRLKQVLVEKETYPVNKSSYILQLAKQRMRNRVQIGFNDKDETLSHEKELNRQHFILKPISIITRPTKTIYRIYIRIVIGILTGNRTLDCRLGLLKSESFTLSLICKFLEHEKMANHAFVTFPKNVEQKGSKKKKLPHSTTQYYSTLIRTEKLNDHLSVDILLQAKQTLLDVVQTHDTPIFLRLSPIRSTSSL